MVLLVVFILGGQMNTLKFLWKCERVGEYVEHNIWSLFLEHILNGCM